MKNSSLKELGNIIMSADKITLLPHHGPDGDSLGSLAGLSIALTKVGKKVKIGLDEEIANIYSYMQKFIELKPTDKLPEADLYVVLDTADTKRILFGEELIQKANEGAKIVILDHHSSGNPEDLTDKYFVDPEYSSNSEIVYELLQEMNLEINKDIATCLLTGIESDTSSFQNQNTSAKTFEAASKLVSKGARISTIVKNAFLEAPINLLKIRGLILERLSFSEKFKTAASYIYLDDFQKYNVSEDMTEGIANLLNGIDGADILFFIKEKEKDVYKVSMRTRNKAIDLSKMAEEYGGGGHKGASGFLWKGQIFNEDGEIVFHQLDKVFKNFPRNA